ncbi:leucine-rich repeat-containing G-protein coupled receptor 5-like isoform X2 [Penaeus chinensis]|uniref:leucine-rich repeat-containing G-protein coupled receptor 5-like isoform X2 n=1 Tax=Penaeus chinensis TaxID=139456 RepID=UPI001FB68491|nr:leucine-rich repeat-containing G-protein coupled receptor 5-like isoform X2 [Penaeus chinensis]
MSPVQHVIHHRVPPRQRLCQDGCTTRPRSPSLRGDGRSSGTHPCGEVMAGGGGSRPHEDQHPQLPPMRKADLSHLRIFYVLRELAASALIVVMQVLCFVTESITHCKNMPKAQGDSRSDDLEALLGRVTSTGNSRKTRFRPRNCISAAMIVLLSLLHGFPAASACPGLCTCSTPPLISRIGAVYDGVIEPRKGVRMECTEAGLSSVPVVEALGDLDPAAVTSMDLSNNNLTSVPDHAFAAYPSLQYLRLSGNRISSVSPKAFQGVKLQNLYLDNNQLVGLVAGSLPESLVELSLEDNFFITIPPAVSLIRDLQTLNLARNKVTHLRNGDLLGNDKLLSLSLHQNQIVEVDDEAFTPLTSLQVLDLTENQLRLIPPAILSLTQLRRLHLGNNQLTYISEESFKGLSLLKQVVLQPNPLAAVHNEAFSHLPSLTKLILKEIRDLEEFPSLNGTHNLELLRIDRASLKSVPDNLCSFTPRLLSLNLHLNSITSIPQLTNCSHLRLLDLSNNALTSLGHYKFVGAPSLQDLLLHHNKITYIPADAFTGLSKLQVLALQHNQIKEIQPDAFLPLVGLEDINLGDNLFSELPHHGLEGVSSIKVHNNRHLRVFPGPESFPNVQILALSYAYHCCPFLSLEEESDETDIISEDVVFDISQIRDIHPALWNTSNTWTDSALANLTSTTSPDIPVMEALNPDSVWRQNSAHATTGARVRPQCIPLPGPFMPCRDLFDWWTLRCGVWIVFLLALMGNGVVVVVLVAAYAKMDVPRFLVTNLAMADFFMGVYLGFLAVVDASTLGEFRMYAIPWQMSPACQVAGFLGVLSSELSVYTLAVITLERNYAITHAMHLQKRLSLRQAAYIMAIGWLFALTMALLPLAGVSDYRKFAVCLPFETDGAGLGYVVFLMFINGVAFLILMGCYFKIYCAIRGSQAWNSNDSRIAKRMALLVFTDLICWAPIAFFSLTAAFNLQLISLEEAKVFTVFILPLNSCCNPFLYALLTKQFKKDCVMLCKTIEESRVTRGIGRCRHSSNFSNRQTPANTNSAIDQSSQGEKQCCNCKGKQEKKRSRMSIISLKYLLCNKGMEELTSSSDMSYQAGGSPHRGPRHASLSSDTYSSSWSDTWRRGRGPTVLRLMDRRRHNSWAATHKPSQESSLSSSRPDSSATTASTATWRISRSSVSSDTSNGSGRFKTGETRLGSIRDRRGDGRQFGVVRQQSQTQLLKEAVPATRPPTARPKPRLQRQAAMERETYTPGKDVLGVDAPPCPLHLRPDNLSCVYEQESQDEENQIPSRTVSPNLQPPLLLAPGTLATSDENNCTEPLQEISLVPPAVSSPARSLQSPQPDSPPEGDEESPAVAATETTALMKPDANAEEPQHGSPKSPSKVLETHFPLDIPVHETRPLI